MSAHDTHCFMVVQPENEFMGCKYGPDEDCPAKKPYPDDPLHYTLVLESYNVRTTIGIDLSPSEVELMNDINRSLLKQNASIVLSVER